MGRALGMIRNVQNWPAYLLHKWGISIRNPMEFLARNGVKVIVPDRMMHTAKEVFFTDDYKFDAIKERVLAITDTPVIVDVGANVGYLSAFSFTRFPQARVYSVEPMPKNLELLNANRERNHKFDWIVFEGVLSSRDGEQEIQYDNSDSFTTSASMYGLDSGPDSLKVQSRKLTTFMAENLLDSAHILKLDCEGAEYDILYCLSEEELNRIGFITMETHQIDHERMNRDSLVKWLESQGWQTQVVRSKVLAENPNFKA